MKANAPEKIYVHIKDKPCEITFSEVIEKGCLNIEYTRTDAFIEKTCTWIKKSITNNPECNRIISKKGVITMGLLIEDFKKYMEGE